MEFSTDIHGRPLKYKIIVKGNRIVTVLYNMNLEQKELTQV